MSFAEGTLGSTGLRVARRQRGRKGAGGGREVRGSGEGATKEGGDSLHVMHLNMYPR